MPVIDIVALALGLGIAVVAAILATSVADSTDESMRWEGGVAVGFAALLYIGPFWIAQLVLTIIATLDGRGVAPGWLWAWWLFAPVLGTTSPAMSLVRLFKRLRSSTPPP